MPLTDHIEKMSEEDFDKYKTALTDRRLEQPKKLSGRCIIFWSEIVSQQFNFDRDEIEVSEVRKLTKKDLLDFFKEFILAKGRRKLACHVLSVTDDGAAKSEPDVQLEDPEAQRVENVVEFRASRPLHSLIRPFVPTSELWRTKKSSSS